jgi:predicted PurR-regulated permease PerM
MTVSMSVVSILKELWNLVIGIIISFYLLGSKEKYAAQAKKIVYAFFSLETANRFISNTRFANKTFGGFFVGKIIDSIIIGILCFICTSIMGTPFCVLISVIVGVTNIIPFFGPFIGAIPGAILILTVDPMQALYFVIFIFILQQFDGNILGPAILGQSTGLGSIWVLFSILIFGDLFGFVGMIIGVPTFAVIYYLISKYVFKKLKEREMDEVVEDYRSRYPDKRIEREEKNIQKNLGKAERLGKWEALIAKFKKKKNR